MFIHYGFEVVNITIETIKYSKYTVNTVTAVKLWYFGDGKITASYTV